MAHKLAGIKSRDIVASKVGESKDQVRRYIRLTELVPELLDLVNEGRIALRPAVELSYISKEDQRMVYEQIIDRECTPSHDQTIRMRKKSDEGILDASVIESIMSEEKPNQVEKFHIPYDQIREFLPQEASYKETCYFIRQALEFYCAYHKKN